MRALHTHAGPIGTYNPDPLNPAARMSGRYQGSDDGAYLSSYLQGHKQPSDLVPATPNYKPCVPCGAGYSTRHTQSTSPKECLADCPCGECCPHVGA